MPVLSNPKHERFAELPRWKQGDFMWLPEAAKRMGTSTRSLRRIVQRENLGNYTMSGRWWVSKSRLTAYLGLTVGH